MMSLSAIRELSDTAARKAARQNKKPYVPYDEAEVAEWGGFPFPNLGTHRPKGWELVEEWLCDSSGFGSSNEPALTPAQLKARIKAQLVQPNATYGYAIIEEGQFQIVLGVFKRLN